MKWDELFEQRDRFFIEMSRSTRGGLGLCIILGLTTFVGGIVSGFETRTWGSFLFNLMFFFSLSLGGVAFGHMQDIIAAKWARPMKRLHESFGAFLPWASAAFLFFLLSIWFHFLKAHELYNWIVDPHMLDHFEGKKIWLEPKFMVIRDVCAVVLTLVLARWSSGLVLHRDHLMLQGKKEESIKFGKKCEEKLRYWSAGILVIYSLTFSLLAFDLTMSLAPTWFSTLWGGWSFAVMMQTLMALLLLMMFCLKSTNLGSFFKRENFHDVGKLLFGFTVFFAYLTYAHVLTYWYTNIPEETSYFITRMQEPWLCFLIVAPFITFFVPFVAFIPKSSKWSAPVAIPVCLLVLVAQWLTYMLVVMPEVVKPEAWSFPWIEIGIFLGFLGVFLWSFFCFAKKNPMLAIGDPLLLESLNEGH